MKIIIIVPTYNERENIGLLIDSLQTEFRKIDHSMGVLVVDDNSPDGTADVVRESMKVFSNVHIIEGEKRGLGEAYIRGMKYAIDVLDADAVMEMDADFSHKPEDVPRLIAALDEGVDFVIGSRYVKGGMIPQDWGLKRKLVSRWGNIFARYVAGLYRVRDCTAGFRAIRGSLLKKIDLTNMNVQGYAFQIALLSKAVNRNAIVREIPVEFIDRVRGETKLSFSDIVEFMLNAWWIRFEQSRTFIKFAIVGASGVVVNLCSFTLFINAGLNKYIASPIAIELSIISNFLFNNFWTFGSRNTKHKFHKRGLMFNAISILSLGVSYTTFVVLSLLFPRVVPQVHQAIGIIPAMCVNYFLNSYWTFRERPASR
ncbi:MAG: glycosyltransferase [Candidatus Dadabacteria bacterium]|nr:glycosyltransferase [Candidatus Dadabacteria bacterium]